jgi:hypothetical protein
MTGPLKQLADVEKATMNWVHWYNTERLHSTLAIVLPEVFEQNYYAQVDASSDDEDTSNKDGLNPARFIQMGLLACEYAV